MTDPSRDELLVQRLFAAGRRETPTMEAESRVARAVEDALLGQASDRAPALEAPAVEISVAPPTRLELRRLRQAVAALSTAAALLLVGGALLVEKHNDDSAAQLAAAEAQLRDLQNQIDAARAEADKQAAAVREATRALVSADDEAARQQAQRDLDVAMQKQSAAAVRAVTAAGAAAKTSASACTCSKMDPLCGCVP